MRRLSFISLILLVGAAAAPQRALAQAGTPPTQKPTPPRADATQSRRSRPPLNRPPLRKRPSPSAACSR